MKCFFYIRVGVIALIGIIFLGYPVLNNYLYEKSQAELASYYQKRSENTPKKERSAQWEKCYEYNSMLLDRDSFLTDPFGSRQPDYDDSQYESLLNLYGDGSMGSLEIPGIADQLIIYHGTDDTTLQNGVGHLRGTSFPVGGTGTHSVLSSHSGVPDRKLFTNLDQMKKGDVFYLNILGERLTYKVDKISVVLPHEIEDILIDPDEDYVTLITCTPYGINSHRLLVRGTRITDEEAERSDTEQPKGISTWTRMYLKKVFVGIAAAAVLELIILLRRRITNL